MVDGKLLQNNILELEVDVVKVPKHIAEKRLQEFQIDAVADADSDVTDWVTSMLDR